MSLLTAVTKSDGDVGLAWDVGRVTRELAAMGYENVGTRGRGDSGTWTLGLEDVFKKKNNNNNT